MNEEDVSPFKRDGGVEHGHNKPQATKNSGPLTAQH